ncbi:LysR family transcriptional regulator [Kribbella sp. NPDC003557]|uniref:LysR family transcriptional regulator n=1 Tax=Kribbella sp. NPDC003557 TaxID=3154449 RepID=UPI0033AAE75E
MHRQSALCELRYFRAVAEDLNITRAAERLGLAQPPLSRAMRRLEHRLGVDLFDCSGQRLALTAAGETLLKESGPVLDALDSAVRRTQRAGQTTKGLGYGEAWCRNRAAAPDRHRAAGRLPGHRGGGERVRGAGGHGARRTG